MDENVGVNLPPPTEITCDKLIFWAFFEPLQKLLGWCRLISRNTGTARRAEVSLGSDVIIHHLLFCRDEWSFSSSPAFRAASPFSPFLSLPCFPLFLTLSELRLLCTFITTIPILAICMKLFIFHHIREISSFASHCKNSSEGIPLIPPKPLLFICRMLMRRCS